MAAVLYSNERSEVMVASRAREHIEGWQEAVASGRVDPADHDWGAGAIDFHADHPSLDSIGTRWEQRADCCTISTCAKHVPWVRGADCALTAGTKKPRQKPRF